MRKSTRRWIQRRERRKSKQSHYWRAPKSEKGRKTGGHAHCDTHLGTWTGMEELRQRLRWSPHAFC